MTNSQNTVVAIIADQKLADHTRNRKYGCILPPFWSVSSFGSRRSIQLSPVSNRIPGTEPAVFEPNETQARPQPPSAPSDTSVRCTKSNAEGGQA